MKILQEGYTFDDVLLIPQHSLVLPREVCLKTKLTRTISLNIPLVSAAMDTVTEYELAIAIALEGGIGILHRHMTITEQAAQVTKVKKTCIPQVKEAANTNAALDSSGHLLVGAAVGADNQTKDRVKALADARVDVIVVDTAHGHSQNVLNTVSWIKKEYPDLQVIGGNIVTAQAALDLVAYGADAVKVGIGPGAACTTRIVAGVGFPQLTAIFNVAQALKDMNIPVIADGGTRFSGDISKALAAGASTVMIGQLFASSKEAPGETYAHEGKLYKTYRGMHSVGALAHKYSTEDQHFLNLIDKLVPEGAEGSVEYKGTVHEIAHQLTGGLRACMGYIGAETIEKMKHKAEFVRIANSGIKESHTHDIRITKPAPNYAAKTSISQA